VFARIDHRAEAEKAGLTMRPAQLVIFGNPKGGTPLMVAAPTAAIVDVPGDRVSADDADAGPALSSPVWLVHATDVHIGASSYATQALTALVSQVIPVMAPTATINTGDLTDDGQATQFALYQNTVKNAVPAYPQYLDLIGNHDVRSGGTTNFLSYSQTGLAGGGVYGLSYLDGPQGRLRVVRTSTVDSAPIPGVTLGYFSDGQKKDLFALPPSTQPVVSTIVAGHHPIKGVVGLQVLGSDGRMEEVLDHFHAAVYLCGHVHLEYLSWIKSTLVVQAPTLGKPDTVAPDPGFALVALDATGPAVRMIGLSKGSAPAVTWPIALITTPADAGLGGTNPHAKAVAPGTAGLVVRVLGFAPKGIQSAKVRVEAGGWINMTSTAPNLWQASVTAPTASGKRSLEALVTSPEGTGSHKISITVAP
jgi:hypothetical protein